LPFLEWICVMLKPGVQRQVVEKPGRRSEDIEPIHATETEDAI